MSDFDFTTGFDANVAIPEDTGSQDKLPFKAMFTTMLTALDEAKAKDLHRFIPCAYFVKERDVEEKKATPAYVRAKVRDQFNGWLKKQDAAVQKRLTLKAYNRAGNEKDFKEKGVSIWIIDTTR